jgi:hypothetical protein
MNDQTPRTPLDGKTFAIGVLSVTACILFVGFVLVTITPREAHGIGETDRSGDYLVATQQLTTSSEGIAVIDAASRQLLLYGFDYTQKVLKILSQIPFDRLRRPREAQGGNDRDRRKP